MNSDDKIQVSFRIHKQLVHDVDVLRQATESPLNLLQYIVALISRSHVLQGQMDIFAIPDSGSTRLTKEQLDDFQKYMPITTEQSIRFQYRTNVLWLSDLKTKAINEMLYQGFLFEKGQLK